MKASYNWLKEFVDITEPSHQLVTRLTNLGLAVDALESHAGDWIFDLDVPTNRPDCLSHFGVAREIAAAYCTALKPPKFELHEGEKRASEIFSISIVDSGLCARYCGRYVAGVKIGPSPQWLR